MTIMEKTIKAVSPIEANLKNTPITFERKLLRKLLVSRGWYLKIKDQVCPLEPVLTIRRSTFSIIRYNQLYEAIANLWDTAGSETTQISRDHLRLTLSDWNTSGRLSDANLADLEQEIEHVFYPMDCPADGDLDAEYPIWLDQRLMQIFRNIVSSGELRGLNHVASLDQVSDLLDGLRSKLPKAARTDRTLWDFYAMDDSLFNGREVLKNYYLNKSETLLLVGQTGVGKSVAILQACLQWGVGEAWLGIEPAKPLRSLVIQAENSDVDIFRKVHGLFKGLQWSESTFTEGAKNVIVVRETGRTGARFFSETVAPALEMHKPDLLVIDPCFSFMAGDSNSQEIVSEFLRHQLHPLLEKYDCACILNHHTGKPAKAQNGQKAQWANTLDNAYAGQGSSEWANFARAMLLLRETRNHGVFDLVAAKNGHYIGWKDDDGKPTLKKVIEYSREAGHIVWREAGKDAIDKLEGGDDKDDAFILVLLTETEENLVKKTEFLESQIGGIGEKRARAAVERLIDSGQIAQVKQGREVYLRKIAVELN
jgi:hypothetical protein